LTTAEAPSSERISDGEAEARALRSRGAEQEHGHDARPSSRRRARRRAGTPSATVTAICRRNTISVETSTAVRYVAAGSGVARSRFRSPPSRRTTRVIARPGERGVRAAVAHHPDEQPVDGRDAVDLPVVDRAEEQEQHRREDEDEDGRLAIPPEEQLLRPQLVPEQPHVTSSAACRRRGRGRRPRASAGAPRDARARAPRRPRGGQLGEHARRLRGREHDLAAALAVADLDVGCRADQLGGRPDPDQRSLADHGDPVGELLGLVEVVRREHDRLPRARSERTSSHAVRRADGSKPVVGSSRKTSSGSPTRATPRSSRRFWPPGERLDALARLVGEPGELDHLVHVARPRVVAREHRVHLAHGQRRRQLRLLEHDADPRSVAASAFHGSAPRTLTSPPSRSRYPSRISTVVVLPAPFGPSRTEDLAGPAPRSRSRERPRARRRTSEAADPDRRVGRHGAGSTSSWAIARREARVDSGHRERDLGAVGLVPDGRDRPVAAGDGVGAPRRSPRCEPPLDLERRAGRRRDQLCGLPRAHERAREHDDRRLRQAREPRGELGGLPPTLPVSSRSSSGSPGAAFACRHR
jgi:hypothetical protein